MNLYAVISDQTGYDPWVTLVAAPTRGAARYGAWRMYGEDENLNEIRYGVRLVQKDTELSPGIHERPATDPLWELAKERTGIWRDDSI